MNENIEALLKFCGVASAMGALVGLGLSFTALSPLVIGGIIGSIAPALLAICLICCKKDPIEEKDLKISPICLGTIALASVTIGVGLAAAAAAIFPGAMIGAGSTALTGAVIGVSAFIAGAFVTNYVIDPIVEKVNKHIISPIVEKVSECFSSKEKG
ncbi:hypothetical protein ACJZL1_00575 [Wolbachia endosymbiont of Rhagoletis indifferens]|uniref:hypothetical protein n=1 Tax=unclassified Wolbachia TaxID=2640676 RepID=UPI00222F7837|nr:hypothetical protein [Wolbachia endosymbiont (group A) of Bibio marci]